MRRLAAVTVARSDYGILRPILDALRDAADFHVDVVAAATHLSPAFGRTVKLLEADGYTPAACVEMTLSGDTPTATAASMGLGVPAFARVLTDLGPDLLLLIGDRFETLAAGVAAVPLGLPVVHVHGGEITEGAFDDQIRHALTKMSHVHLVSTTDAGRRVAQMGEEEWRICVSGAPGLDTFRTARRLSADELEYRVGIPLPSPPLLVTLHPATLHLQGIDAELSALLAALRTSERPVVVTAPNANPSYAAIRSAWESLVAERPGRVAFVENLGMDAYVSLLHAAAAMVGNSSSGIIEAPSVPLPVVNIGSRQAGRTRAANVIDVPGEAEAIAAAMATATSPAFRASLSGLVNPYGDGHAAARVLTHLQGLPSRSVLLRKVFRDAPF